MTADQLTHTVIDKIEAHSFAFRKISETLDMSIKVLASQELNPYGPNAWFGFLKDISERHDLNIYELRRDTVLPMLMEMREQHFNSLLAIINNPNGENAGS